MSKGCNISVGTLTLVEVQRYIVLRNENLLTRQILVVNSKNLSFA